MPAKIVNKKSMGSRQNLAGDLFEGLELNKTHFILLVNGLSCFVVNFDHFTIGKELTESVGTEDVA